MISQPQAVTDHILAAEIVTVDAKGHANVKLVLMEFGHELTDVLDSMWAQIAGFLSVPETIDRESITLSVD